MTELLGLGYLGLFIAAFLAATVVPFSSEVIFSAMVFGASAGLAAARRRCSNGRTLWVTCAQIAASSWLRHRGGLMRWVAAK